MLRTLFKSDLPHVLTIEKSVQVAPWTDETFKTCLQAGCFGWVIELENKVIAYTIFSMNHDECHVLNLGVANEYQHQGWGRMLLLRALEHAREKKILVAFLEVRRSNSRAIALYQKMGFYQVGERTGYYPTVVGNEDALVFALSLYENISK